MDIEGGLDLGECGPEGPAREEPRSGDLSSIIYFMRVRGNGRKGPFIGLIITSK